NRLDQRQSAAGDRRRDGRRQPDALARRRLRLLTDRRLLPREYVPRLPHQRLPDVPHRQAQLRGRGGDAEKISTAVTPVHFPDVVVAVAVGTGGAKKLIPAGIFTGGLPGGMAVPVGFGLSAPSATRA